MFVNNSVALESFLCQSGFSLPGFVAFNSHWIWFKNIPGPNHDTHNERGSSGLGGTSHAMKWFSKFYILFSSSQLECCVVDGWHEKPSVCWSHFLISLCRGTDLFYWKFHHGHHSSNDCLHCMVPVSHTFCQSISLVSLSRWLSAAYFIALPNGGFPK